MSDKKMKRPAHEVIMEKLKERTEELQIPGNGCHEDLRILGVIAILLDVLREMVIPEKERDKILFELQELAASWKTSIVIPNMPVALYNILLNEK